MKVIKKFLSIILVFAIMLCGMPRYTIQAKAESEFEKTYTDSLEFLNDDMAKSFIAFIYNIPDKKVTDLMMNQNNIFNYLTGKLQKGTDEYTIAQLSFLLTSSFFIDKHLDSANQMYSTSSDNLVNILMNEIDISEQDSNIKMNCCLNEIKTPIVKILSTINEVPEETIDIALSVYADDSDIISKVENFVFAIKTTIYSLTYLKANNTIKAYNYYKTYVNNRNHEYCELILDAYNLSNTSFFDGVLTFLDYIGFGNSWTNKDVQRILRTFGEFTYHSIQEIQNLSNTSSSNTTITPTVKSVRFAINHYTLFFNWILTNPAIALPTNAIDRNVTYRSSNTNIATVDSTGKIIPVSPGTVTITASTPNGTSDKCTITILPFYADKTNNTYTITNYVGNGGNVTIPSYVNECPVVAIEDCAFLGTNITSITIPDNIISIGNYAFQKCNSLKSVSLPNNLTTIGEYAFSLCANLTSITIPNSVTDIGKCAFWDSTALSNIKLSNNITAIKENTFDGCKSLTAITIPKNVKSLKEYAFFGCSKLSSISFENNSTLNTIGKQAFYQCSSLTNINIPNNVTSIGDSAFRYCRNLTNVTIGNSVTTIGFLAFDSCDSLTSIIIPNSVTTIDDSAFSECNSLTSITIGNSVTTIGDSAFSSCDSLKSIIIPNSVTTIGYNAFAYCSSLTSITIPDSVTTIGNLAFYFCHSLTSINVSSANSNYSSDNGVLFNKNKTTLICCPNGKNASYNIPNSVTTIGDNAFEFCSGLTSITIPNSVTSIGSFAFSGCSKLTNITLPDSVTIISGATFAYCRNLTSVTIGNSVTRINSKAFLSCSSLSHITIPNSVTSIDNDAFSYCDSLTSITIPDSVTSIGNNAFEYCNSLTDVYYLNTQENWKKINSTSGNEYLLNANIHYYSPGDVDFDGQKNLKDLVSLAQYLAGWDVNMIYPESLDLNGDGATNLEDLTHFARYAAGWNVTLNQIQ